MEEKIINPENLSPIAWAYIGDSFYELTMRLLTLEEGPKRMHVMHKMTAKFSNAAFQSKAAHAMEPMLTTEEQDILRRGRNAKGGHVPKSASPTEYRMSTGLEALIGYLYLTGRQERARELIRVMRTVLEEEKQ